MMKKHFLICLSLCLSALAQAQKVDTVAEKIAKLQDIKWEIHPTCVDLPLETYVSTNFKRPETLNKNFSGNVVVRVLVDQTGKANEVELLKTQSKEIDEEAVRVLNSVKWHPAIYNLEPISFNLVMDIRVRNDSTRNVFKVSTYILSHPKSLSKTTESDSSNMTVIPDVDPTFPGGFDAFISYSKKHLVYPANAMNKNIQGNIYLNFVVEKDGSLSNIHVLGSPDGELALEALRILKNSPKFIPGTKDGRPVRTTVSMPISFRLN